LFHFDFLFVFFLPNAATNNDNIWRNRKESLIKVSISGSRSPEPAVALAVSDNRYTETQVFGGIKIQQYRNQPDIL